MIQFSKASLMAIDQIKHELTTDFANLLQRESFILAAEVSSFEAEFASYLGTKHCIGVANGTDALELALRALKVGAGARVATVANAGNYTSTAARLIGAEPVYMDVSEDTGLVTLEEVQRSLDRDSPEAIVVTHLYGQIVPEIVDIADLAKKRGVHLVEDCSQAHGASLDGARAGTFGSMGIFSHYPTKNLGGLGDGGSICTSSNELGQKLRRLRQYGWHPKYVSAELGRNSRLDELQASFLRRLLPYLDGENSLRRSIAKRYFEGIVPVRKRLGHFKWSWDESYVAHLFPILVKPELRKSLQAHLDRMGIAHAVHFPVPDHRQNGFSSQTSLPNTERQCDSVLSLPMHTSLNDHEIDTVINAVNTWAGSSGG